jgi:hypothetical protein
MMLRYSMFLKVTARKSYQPILKNMQTKKELR